MALQPKNSNSKIVRKFKKVSGKKKGSELDGLSWEKREDSAGNLVSPNGGANPNLDDIALPLADEKDKEKEKDHKEMKFRRQNSAVLGRQKSQKSLKKSITKPESFQHDMFPTVTEEEMYLRETDESSFRVYIVCDETPGSFYECTFKHPMTIAQVCIDLCLEFQVGLQKNIATHRMHIVSQNDPLDKKVRVLRPVHKGEYEPRPQRRFSSFEQEPETPERDQVEKKTKKPSKSPKAKPLDQPLSKQRALLFTRSTTIVEGKTALSKKSPRSPPLKARASSPCDLLSPSLRSSSPCDLSSSLTSFRPSSARTEKPERNWDSKNKKEEDKDGQKLPEDDWELVLKSESLPFLLHTAMHIPIHEIQTILDSRGLEYRFIMMQPKLRGQLEIVDKIMTDDLSEWEGLIGRFYWGPLSPNSSPNSSSLTTSSSFPSIELSSFWTSRVDCECEKKGWKVEDGKRPIMDSSTLQPVKLLRPRMPLYLCSQPYATFFLNRGHDNYMAGTDDCPVVVTVEKPEDDKSKALESGLKLLVRSGLDDMRCRSHSSSAKEIAKILSGIRPSLSGLKLKKIVTDAAIQRLLLNFELNTQLPQKMKFGVLCCKPGQTLDDEMFANQSGSAHYEEFLSFLGEKIRLKGWEGYRGGLDVQNDTTGEYGLYTKFSDVDIIFHVSTLLPFDVADKQHLERKRHLGNDVCVVIFIDIPEEEEMKEWEVREGQENGEEDKNQEEKGNEEKKEDTIKRGLFHPASISSHFNHVFLVVSVNHRATREMGSTHYNITIVNKSGVRPFEPFIHDEPMGQNEATRQLILTKLINGEVTALTAPEFMHSQQRTRTQLLAQLIKDIQETK